MRRGRELTAGPLAMRRWLVTEALFTPRDGGFMPTPYSRSPWGQNTLHGGPVAALLAHQVEQRTPDSSLRIARLTTDLFRPAPLVPLTVDTEVLRDGKRIMAMRASLIADGVEVSRAQALLARTSHVDASATDLLPDPIPFPEDAEESSLIAHDGEPAYSKTVRFRYSVERGVEQPVAVWIHVPLQLMPGVALTPAVRAAATSDYVSAFSAWHSGRGRGVPFINADITLYLFRPPAGEWLCLAQMDRGSHEGIAAGAGFLYDLAGPVGRCAACSVSRPPPRR